MADPDRAVFYTSGRASNEAAFVYQLLARRFGTNNLPDCSNMCHESSGAALNQTIGIGKGTVTLKDIAEHADLIIIVGQNPGTNHPRMLTSLEDAKKRGARIVAINPLPEAGLVRFQEPADAARARRPGDQARRPPPVGARQRRPRPVRRREPGAARARGREPGTVLDHDFIERYCDGFDEAVDALARPGLGGHRGARAD